MFDSSAARLGACEEITVAEERLQDADIFARDPLACSFTFLDGAGAARNDLVVISYPRVDLDGDSARRYC